LIIEYKCPEHFCRRLRCAVAIVGEHEFVSVFVGSDLDPRLLEREARIVVMPPTRLLDVVAQVAFDPGPRSIELVKDAL
jgi:hypothetical protein